MPPSRPTAIYAGWLRAAVAAERLPAAISIGTNPTFDGSERRVEAYCLDRDGLDLYGERVALDFGPRLRATLKFDGVDALLDADGPRRRPREGAHRWLGRPASR